MDRHPYGTTLSDDEWALLEPLFPAEHSVGRPRTHAIRTILDAIFYAVRAGHAWRLLPQEWPPWKTVYPYHYFRAWRLNGTWERIHTVLREAVRVRVGREAQPSAAIIDSQSAKTAEQGGPHSFDGGKKINGRKRHLLVDPRGLLLKVVVHPAGVHDRSGAKQVLRGLQWEYPRLEHIWADQGYAGALQAWTREQTGDRAGSGLSVVAADQTLFPGHARAPGRRERLSCATAPLGRGTDLCLAREISPLEQGL
jgi:putative transposase